MASRAAPIELTAERTAPLLKKGQYRIYEDAPHGLMFTHMERLHADHEAFLHEGSAA